MHVGNTLNSGVRGCWTTMIDNITQLNLILPMSPGLGKWEKGWYGEYCRSKYLRMLQQHSFIDNPMHVIPQLKLWRAHHFHLDSPFHHHTASVGAHRHGSPGSWTCQLHRWWVPENPAKKKKRMPLRLYSAGPPKKMYHLYFQ